MPIYEYECENCHRVEEYLHSIKDRDTEHKCPSCDSIMKRKLSQVDYKFKGAPPRNWKHPSKSTADIMKSSDMIKSRNEKML